MSLKAVLRVSERLGDIAWHIRGQERKLALGNLRIAFPQKSEEERTEIARQVARNLIRNGLELIWLLGHRDLISKLVRVEGVEHLRDAISTGNGVILLTAHFGNFMLLSARLAEESDRVSVLINMPPDAKMADMIRRYQERVGVHPIARSPEWASFRECLRRLQNGEVVCLIADEEARSGGVFVDFFGYLVPTPKGPAALAIRSGAEVVPAFAYHLPGGSQKIVIDRPLKIPRNDTQDSITEATAILTKVIERVIRDDPTQWSWITHRWRKRRGKVEDSGGLS